MAIEEVAKALGLTPAMVKSDWRFARACLQQQLGPGRQPE
jgi:DNA-directed RNA polymerase specialized sigma24 family protein